MNYLKSFFPVFILGSFWGFIEILHIPLSVVSGIALLILAMNRVISPMNTAAVVLGLVVCFYKTYSDNFFVCQWTGVLALAVSFAVLSRFFWTDNIREWYTLSLLGVLTNFVACALFAGAVIFLAHEPHWVAGGWHRVVSYFWKDVFPASLISIVATPAGMALGMIWKEHQEMIEGKIAIGVSLAAVLVVWIVASANRFRG
jgi:hypothetical protein